MTNDTFSDRDYYVLDSMGVVIGRSKIGANALEQIKSAALASAPNEPRKFPIMDKSPVFLELMTHPWIVSGCERLMGSGFRFDHGFGLRQNLKDPNSNLHGGPLTCQRASFYTGGLNNGAVLAGRVSVGLVLQHQSPQTGGFCFIPGSHKSFFAIHGHDILESVLAERKFEDDCIVVPELHPGDLLFFVEALVHGTSPWRRKEPRIAVYFMYAPGFIVWRHYSETERYLELAKTPLQKQLLRPPFVAEIREDETTWGENMWRSPNRG